MVVTLKGPPLLLPQQIGAPNPQAMHNAEIGPEQKVDRFRGHPENGKWAIIWLIGVTGKYPYEFLLTIRVV